MPSTNSYRTLPSTAHAASFPLGGIGTGNVGLGARGELRDWEIFGTPGRGNYLPYSFFALRTEFADGRVDSRVLEARISGEHEASHGYYPGAMAGLPRFESSTLEGRYPLAHVALSEPSLPLSVTLDAFTPLVPLDSHNSGLPTAIMRYTVTNDSDQAVDAVIAGSLFNAVGFDGYELFFYPTQEGTPSNHYRETSATRGILSTSDLAPSHHRFGSMAITSTDFSGTAKESWLQGAWWDGAQDFWNEFTASGDLLLQSAPPGKAGPLSEPTKAQIGSLAIRHRIEPGQSQQFEFLISWHFPNRPRGWEGHIILDDPYVDETIGNFYGAQFDDAWAVADYVHENLGWLEATTVDFTDALFGSTLAGPVVEAVAAGIAVARSSTCFRLADGTFLAWEGTFDHQGSCEGTCTHVWNYAQTMSFLWPDLERSARRTEFLTETDQDGRMSFRANRVFGGGTWDMLPAVDGQLGTVVRLYREWTVSGDDEFLVELWPSAKRALEYAFTRWDSDGDFVLDAEQHNTYDIEFQGVTSLANTVFYAALHAGARIAEYLGDSESAQGYRDAAAKGSALMDSMLWNGEYYEQRIDDLDEYRYQYGTGVLADQVFGQFLAHVVGLGHVIPAEHSASAVRAVFAHNFIPDLSAHESVQRTYALNNEGGLVLCTWPRGGRPRLPFAYSDEVWTGIEYQVAAHLAYEGATDEALQIVAAVRDRQDGFARDPWNDVECGNHYARAMSSWALLLAFSGLRIDAPSAQVVLTRPTAGRGVLFTSGSGWGTADVEVGPDGGSLELTVHGGHLDVASLSLPGAPSAAVLLDGRELNVTVQGTTAYIDRITVATGGTLRVAWSE